MATHSSILAWGILMDRGAWRAYSPWGPKESDTTERLSTKRRGKMHVKKNVYVYIHIHVNINVNICIYTCKIYVYIYIVRCKIYAKIHIYM